MAGYPSLQNMPGLPETVAECEMSGVLVGPGSGPQGISELVRSYPACNLASKQQEMRQAAANINTDPSSLFLPREGGRSVVSEGRSLRTMYRLALTELTELISSSLSSGLLSYETSLFLQQLVLFVLQLPGGRLSGLPALLQTKLGPLLLPPLGADHLHLLSGGC